MCRHHAWPGTQLSSADLNITYCLGQVSILESLIRRIARLC